MESVDERFIELGLTVIGSAIFGLVGFVWKISHKVSAAEKNIEAMRDMVRRQNDETKRDVDYLLNKVEKQSDKMLSFAKDIHHK